MHTIKIKEVLRHLLIKPNNTYEFWNIGESHIFSQCCMPLLKETILSHTFRILPRKPEISSKPYKKYLNVVEQLSPPTFWYQRLVHRTIHEETLRRHLPGAAVVQPVRNRDHRAN